ncbi:MAG: serine hydrolase domain-containing protein [Chitinophagales bacterium]
MKYRLPVLFVFCFVILVSSCHFVRSVIFLRPNHTDDRKFPKKELVASDEIYEWTYHDEQLDLTSIKITLKDSTVTNLEDLFSISAINAFMIVQEGKVLSENYFAKYDAERTHGSFSVSKAMLATVLGIALDRGFVTSLDEPITTYIPELLENDTAFGNITIHHLFDMNSGIEVRKNDASLLGDLARTYYGSNWARFMATIEIEKEPGGVHKYNQTDAELLTLLLTRALGVSVSDFFAANVWQKIGASTAYWNVYDRDKLEKGFCCFNARVQDYAKFGQLYLQNGEWNGEQIVPKDWVEFTTQAQHELRENWIFDFNHYWFPAADGKNDYTAQGYNRQFIYVNPDKNLLILRFGRKENEKNIGWEKVLREIAQQL